MRLSRTFSTNGNEEASPCIQVWMPASSVMSKPRSMPSIIMLRQAQSSGVARFLSQQLDRLVKELEDLGG